MNIKESANVIEAILIGIIIAISFTSIGQTVLQKSVLDFLLPITVIGYFLVDIKLNPLTQE